MLARSPEENPTDRHLIADLLLEAGRTSEADKLYAAIREEVPLDARLHSAAAWAYHASGDDQKAFRWVTDGIEVGLSTSENGRLIVEMAILRGNLLEVMGRPHDSLQERAEPYIDGNRPTETQGPPTWRPLP